VQIRLVREEASVPLVANGDVRSLDDVERIHERTGVSGAMAARGLLENPAMFAGYAQTPDECINDYVYTALQLGTKYEVFWKTLQWMLGETLNKADRIEFNSNASVAGCVDFLRSRGLSLEPSSRLLPLSPLPVK
jgi:tRNA-dihydrouridine synthase 4